MKTKNVTGKNGKQYEIKSYSKQDIANQFFDLFTENLEQLRWREMWQRVADDTQPYNAVSKKNYQRTNLFFLTFVVMAKKLKSNCFLSYKQAIDLGGKVKKGEKAFYIWRPKPYSFIKDLSLDPDEVDLQVINRMSFKRIPIFSFDSTEGIEKEKIKVTIKNPLKMRKDKKIEFMLSELGVNIQYKGTQPCYIPSLNIIEMTPSKLFNDKESYYSVLLHEFSHWTKNNIDSCKREGSFGKGFVYAKEELIAEISSMILCAYFGYATEAIFEGARSYVNNWLRACKCKNDADRKMQIYDATLKAVDILSAVKELFDPKQTDLELDN